MAAMATSPTAPTMKGRAPCLKRSLRLVRRPTPAKVRRKAQRLRFPSAASWDLLKPSCGDGWVGGGAEGGEERDEEESEDELGELVPEKGGFVLDLCCGSAAGESFARPLDGVGQDDEADESVAAGFGEDGEFSGGVGVEGSGGGCFGGVIDGETGPEAVGAIGHGAGRGR